MYAMQYSNPEDRYRNELQNLQEFIYKHTSEWAEKIQDILPETDQFEKGKLILFECIFLFIHLTERISHNKLSEQKAKKLGEALRFFIILGIVDIMYDENEEDKKQIERAQLLKIIEKRHIHYTSCTELYKKSDPTSDTSLVGRFSKQLIEVMEISDEEDVGALREIVGELAIKFILSELKTFENLILRAGNELAIEIV